MRRKNFLVTGAAVLASGACCGAATAVDSTAEPAAFDESTIGGRLGVYAREIGSGRTLTHRAGERFPMCSTFKVLAVAAVLQRVDRRREQLVRRIAYGKADLLEYAPVTTAHVAAGSMTVAALCEAAIVFSDNTAANLLLRTLGGPSGVTAFVRAAPFHDPTTRLDRNEPALNSATPGDARDTTSPMRMANALALLLTTHDVLTPPSARMLERWMRDCKTGTKALRAGIPPGWEVADKTGSGANGTRNDIAVIRRSHGAPIVIAAYLTGATTITEARRNAALAEIGRVVAAAFA